MRGCIASRVPTLPPRAAVDRRECMARMQQPTGAAPHLANPAIRQDSHQPPSDNTLHKFGHAITGSFCHPMMYGSTLTVLRMIAASTLRRYGQRRWSLLLRSSPRTRMRGRRPGRCRGATRDSSLGSWADLGGMRWLLRAVLPTAEPRRGWRCAQGSAKIALGRASSHSCRPRSLAESDAVGALRCSPGVEPPANVPGEVLPTAQSAT